VFTFCLSAFHAASRYQKLLDSGGGQFLKGQIYKLDLFPFYKRRKPSSCNTFIIIQPNQNFAIFLYLTLPEIHHA
jgi:hypothetical protein